MSEQYEKWEMRALPARRGSGNYTPEELDELAKEEADVRRHNASVWVYAMAKIKEDEPKDDCEFTENKRDWVDLALGVTAWSLLALLCAMIAMLVIGVLFLGWQVSA